MDDDRKWGVKVITKKTGEVVKEIEAVSLWDADRIESGISLHLNHETYYTRVERQMPDRPRVRVAGAGGYTFS